MPSESNNGLSETKEDFLNTLGELDCLGQVSSLLGWDEQVNLPENPISAKQRATQSATVAELQHKQITSPAFSDKLKRLEDHSEELDEDWKVILREARRDLDKAAKIPSEFVSIQANHASASYHAWKQARQKNDFASYSGYLEKTLSLAKEEASFLGFDENPYDYHIDKHDPGMTTAKVGKLFDELRSELVPLSERILALAEEKASPKMVGFPPELQETFLREVVESLGFDLSRGRIDIAVHPFCSGNGADTRLTTRYDENNPLDSLFSAIHEAGHGMYEQGLPERWMGTPLGEAAGMAVHESQSRIWENQVGRSVQFWEIWTARFRELFEKPLNGIDDEQLYLAVNKVSRNPIRVDADEVTYNLHVILRFEIEKALFSGDLTVNQLADAWSEKAQELLGLKPRNDSVGVLQDVHWSGGAFGYFPSYCLGNLLAAQLWEKAKEEDAANPAEPSKLLSWLQEKVHRHGRRFSLEELSLKATGKSLSSESFITYLGERYLTLYQS